MAGRSARVASDAAKLELRWIVSARRNKKPRQRPCGRWPGNAMRLFVAKWYLNITRVLRWDGEFGNSPVEMRAGGTGCAGFGELEVAEEARR